MKMLLFLILLLLPFVKSEPDDNYSHLKTFKNLTRFVEFIYWSTRERYEEKYIPHFAENFVYYCVGFAVDRDGFAYINALRKTRLVGGLLDAKPKGFEYGFEENGERRRYRLLSVIANTTEGFTELKIYKLNDYKHFRLVSGSHLWEHSRKIPEKYRKKTTYN